MNLDITSKNLYFIILRALIGFNIFHSLFGRDSVGNTECGSWFFPNLDSRSTGFMATGDLACPQNIQGKFIEALMSAIFLGVVWYFGRQRKPKVKYDPIPDRI